MADVAVAAGGLLVAGAEITEETRIGVRRGIDRLAEDNLLVGTRAAQQRQTRCQEMDAATVGPDCNRHQNRLNAGWEWDLSSAIMGSPSRYASAHRMCYGLHRIFIVLQAIG